MTEPPVIEELKEEEDKTKSAEVEVEDVEEEEENGNELTDNTPETRIKVFKMKYIQSIQFQVFGFLYRSIKS